METCTSGKCDEKDQPKDQCQHGQVLHVSCFIYSRKTNGWYRNVNSKHISPAGSCDHYKVFQVDVWNTAAAIAYDNTIRYTVRIECFCLRFDFFRNEMWKQYTYIMNQEWRHLTVYYNFYQIFRGTANMLNIYFHI